MKEILGDLLIIAAGIILLLHFILFWLVGWLKIGEPNVWIRGAETAMCIGIIIIGFERLCDDVKRGG